jgi:hypothetical protein
MRRILQITCLIFLFAEYCAGISPGGYSSSSVLSSGVWFKVAVTSDGIYRLDYSSLKQKGLQNPSNPHIYCNNSGQLSFYNDGTAPDDLQEISIYTSTGSDGIFNEGDYLLFYGKGTHRWVFKKGVYSYLRQNYSDTAFYFITSGSSPVKKITAAPIPATAENYSSSQSDALFIHEIESENLIKSGRDWFQRLSGTPLEIKPGFSDLVTGEKIQARIRTAARGQATSEFIFSEAGVAKKSLIMQPVSYSNFTGTYASISDSSFLLQSTSASPSFEIRYNRNGDQSAIGWLDYITLCARTINTFNSKFRQYNDARSVAPGRITSFSIKTQASDAIIWDVTDQLNPRSISYTRSGENITFRSRTDSLRTFVAFSPANATFPEIRPGNVPNQDLHSSGQADMIIIAHPMFRDYAAKLADIHFAKDNIVTQIVTPSQIYNEFSGGIQDIAALRNFIRMKYLKQLNTSRPLKYLLLFGDGSYENKTPPPKNQCFIPTYQSKNSNVFVSSFTSDDFYALLEDGEGEAEGTEDIGVGRFPVSDTVQAGIMISKIRKYINPVNMGDWRNLITIAADDEDGNAHMSDAEGLSGEINSHNPEYNIQKIYLDAFNQVTTSTGQSYPEVNAAINERINAGCLIFNYVGHGSEIGLAHERVVRNEDIKNWKNGGRLPLFITATCEFSRFDDTETNIATGELPDKPSSGELALLNKNGGAIALMSTTRVVFSAPNFFLNKNIFSTIFERDSTGKSLRLGDIIRIAKLKTGSGSNKRNFTLLGDPALTLAWPWHGKVITDSINNIAASGSIDSLKALSMITVSGHVQDNSGKLMNDFNGIVLPVVYDKEKAIRTLANDGGPSMTFPVRNNILFNGKVNVRNGRFRFSFIVPKDIDYTYGSGKLSYYAWNDDGDMNGSSQNITVGGFSRMSFTDTEGPSIRLFMNDTLFRNGGLTDENPVLLALLEDKGGINTTGWGIGHDLTGYLDNEKNIPFVLNSFFVNDIDHYSKGTIHYDLSGLAEGSHSFTLKAWDNFNNSSEETLLFMVNKEGKFILKNLFNYPNPFTSNTTITAETNRPGSNLDIVVSIYSMSGKLIKTLKAVMPSTGYVLPPVEWDGNDDSGNRVAPGIYPYIVSVTAENNKTTRASGRMIIL